MTIGGIRRQKNLPVPLWVAYTGITAGLKLCLVVSLGEGRNKRWLDSVLAAGRVTVGVRGSLSPQLRHSLRTSFQWLKEEDSEAPRHLAAAAAAFPSTSWGPAELLCGSQRRETRCTLWHKHRPRGAVQVTPSVGVCHRDSHCEEEKGGGGEMWRRCKFTLNKRISIDKIGPACVSKTPKVSSHKLLVSDCNTVNHVGGFHTLAQCQIFSQWHQSTVNLSVNACKLNYTWFYTPGLSVHFDKCALH